MGEGILLVVSVGQHSLRPVGRGHFPANIILLDWLGCIGVELFRRHLVEVIPTLKLM